MSLLAGYWMPESGDAAEREKLSTWLAKLRSTYGTKARLIAHHPQSSLQSLSMSLNVSHLCEGGDACVGNPHNGGRGDDDGNGGGRVNNGNDRWDIGLLAEPGRLVLKRHRLGRSALFWMRRGQSIAFSNRFASLPPLLDERCMSINSVYAFSCLSYLPAPWTPLDQIHQVEAGTELSFDSSLNGTTSDAYSRFAEAPPEQRIAEESEAIRQLRALLEEAVQESFSDLTGGEVGVFLSGGLDSSLTAALLARAGCKVRCFALDFGEFGITELSFAEAVCEHLGVPLQKVDARPGKIKEALPHAIDALDMPFGDGVTVPLFLLAQAASGRVGTVFNGEGGDQLFAGWTNKPMIASSIYTGQSAIDAEEEAFLDQYFKTFHRFHGHEERTFSPNFLAQIKHSRCPINDELRQLIEPAVDARHTTSLLHRLRRANLMLKGAQNIQPRATNLAAHFGLNLRSLFCYEPLVDWTFRVSPRLYLRGAHEKYLLKRAVEGCLPQAVVWREKRGMGVPLTEWLLGPLRREAWRWLNPAVLSEEGIFREDLPDQIGTARFGGLIVGRRIGEMLWLLLSWQAWRCRVLGTNLPGKLYNPFWLRRNPLEE